MNGIKQFFLGLSKSTKITMITCVFFILLTLLVLCFFILFPITPSATTVAKIGKDGMVYREPGVTTTVVTTTIEEETTVTTTATVTEVAEETNRITFTTPDLGGYNNNYIQETPAPQQTYTETAPVIGENENNSGEYGIESSEESPVQTVTEPPAEVTDAPAGIVTDAPPLAPDMPVQTTPTPGISGETPTIEAPQEVPTMAPNEGPEIVLD